MITGGAFAVFIFVSQGAQAASLETTAIAKESAATAMAAGNIGLMLRYQFQDLDNFNTKAKATALLSELREFKSAEYQKTVDQFGRFVDDLPLQRAALFEKALTFLAKNGKFDSKIFSIGDAPLKNVVLAFDLAPLVAQLAKSPVLRTVYGNFLGKTADGQALGVLVPPTTRGVYIMRNAEPLFEAPIVGDSATIPFSTIEELRDEGRLVLAIQNEFDQSAETYVIPVVPEPFVAAAGKGTPQTIDDLRAELRAQSGGIGGLIMLLAQNARSCTPLATPLAVAPFAVGGVGDEKNFLAQLKDVLMRMIEKLFGLFRARAAEPAATITTVEVCAAVGARGEPSALMFRAFGTGFGSRSTMTFEGVGQPTTVQNGTLVAAGANNAGAIGVKTYPPFQAQISGTNFNASDVIRVNGVDVATAKESEGVLSATIGDELLWQKLSLTVYNPISKKESSPALELWAIGFPPADALKASVTEAARAAGLALRPVPPTEPSEAYGYYYDLWKSVAAVKK